MRFDAAAPAHAPPACRSRRRVTARRNAPPRARLSLGRAGDPHLHRHAARRSSARVRLRAASPRPPSTRCAATRILFEQRVLALPDDAAVARLDPHRTAAVPSTASATTSATRSTARSIDTLPAMLKRAGYATGGAVSAYVLRADTGRRPAFDFYDDALAAQRTCASRTVGSAPARRHGGDREAVDRRTRVSSRSSSSCTSSSRTRRTTPPEPFRSRYADCLRRRDRRRRRRRRRVHRRARRRSGIYDRAVIVLLSDHGEGLGDHGEGRARHLPLSRSPCACR